MNVEPAGGGSPLLSIPILTAQAQTAVPDTGNLAGVVDLAFVGQTIRMSFDFFVPNDFSGPAFFQFDDVRVAQDPWIANGSVRKSAHGEIRWSASSACRTPEIPWARGGGQIEGADHPGRPMRAKAERS